jgi:ABC-2 type transport system permease protein
MPIFDQGYQHWNGKLSGHLWRWLAITRFGVAAQWKSWWVRAVVLAALSPALALVAFLVVWGLFEQKSSLIDPLINLLSTLPDELKQGTRGYRGVFWTMAFHYFFGIELFFSMFLVLLVGPNLISQDLRYNAIPLYFSRPLRRIDYFVGKLGVIGTYVAVVSIVPALLAYALGVAFSFDSKVFHDTGRLLVASIAYGSVIVVSAGTMMLAISSLSRNSRMVGAFWIGLWIISGVAGASLTQIVKRDWCPAVSYQADLLRIREAMLGTAEARTKIRELFEAGQQRVQEAMIPAIGLGGRRRNSFRGAPPPMAPRQFGRPAEPGYDEDGNSIYPWQWSAGVLAALVGLSVWTLSSRVKSLDRLK